MKPYRLLPPLEVAIGDQHSPSQTKQHCVNCTVFTSMPYWQNIKNNLKNGFYLLSDFSEMYVVCFFKRESIPNTTQFISA